MEMGFRWDFAYKILPDMLWATLNTIIAAGVGYAIALVVGLFFYDIASKLTSHQLICIMKVISDGPENDIRKLNNNKIFNLINSNVSDIKKIITKYEQLSNSDWSRRQKPRLFDYVTTKSHFSETQKHQLESLLRRIKIILDDNEVFEMIKDCKNSSIFFAILVFTFGFP